MSYEFLVLSKILRNMTARLLPFIFWVWSASVYGQVQKQAWLLKWDATAITDPTTPAALYSLEIPLKERWSLEVGYGMPLYYLNGN